MLFCPTPAHFTAPDFNPKPPPGGYIILSKLILQTPAASLTAPTDNITTNNVSFFFSLSSFYRNTTPFLLNFLPKAVKTTHVLLGSVVSFSEVAPSRAGDNYITQNAHCLPESSQLTTQCWLNARLILGDRSVCVCVCSSMSEYPTFQHGSSRFDQVLLFFKVNNRKFTAGGCDM